MSPQIVKLDIGGVYYKVSLQTLLVENSYFSALFSGNWNEETDENGRIFIDRDGRAFEYVLNYLRNNGSTVVLPESAEMRQRVRQEADFYILPELAELLDSEVNLNVGGIFYTTSAKTLSGEVKFSENPFFSNLLSGDSEKCHNGRIFIDRDGKAFEYVLDFLRNGKKMTFPDSSEMKERISKEAEFYRLPELSNLLNPEKNKVSFRIKGGSRIGGTAGFRSCDLPITISLANMKSFPGCWFDRTFCTSNEVDLPHDINGVYIIDRGDNAMASVLLAEYISGHTDRLKDIGPGQSVDVTGLMKAADFFRLPRILVTQIMQCVKQ